MAGPGVDSFSVISTTLCDDDQVSKESLKPNPVWFG